MENTILAPKKVKPSTLVTFGHALEWDDDFRTAVEELKNPLSELAMKRLKEAYKMSAESVKTEKEKSLLNNQKELSLKTLSYQSDFSGLTHQVVSVAREFINDIDFMEILEEEYRYMKDFGFDKKQITAFLTLANKHKKDLYAKLEEIGFNGQVTKAANPNTQHKPWQSMCCNRNKGTSEAGSTLAGVNAGLLAFAGIGTAVGGASILAGLFACIFGD